MTLRVVLVLLLIQGSWNVDGQPRRILVDTDVDTDDVFALFYLLKHNTTEFDLQAITINGNGWSDGGHAVNHIYDILFMMGRDDISVGVGGDGGITPNSTILPNVGGFLPLIDQGMSTGGSCRYRQAIPLDRMGRLDVNSNFGLRRAFLPQGKRKYTPLEQPSVQQVMKKAISEGPITIFLMGAHTNLAIFLLSNPHLKKNIEHIYAMGGAIRPQCSKFHKGEEKCSHIGNLYPPDSNSFAEFNIFGDPFAAYKVLHSGIPMTLVPLDATSTIPVNKNFFLAFKQRQNTYEAQYCFQSLKMAHDNWFGNDFFQTYSMWDSFMVGVALSQMRNGQHGENEFAVLEYMNITVITSNKPYGVLDGSNPLVDDRLVPKFDVERDGVHSGHVQMGMRDPFCLVAEGEKGNCQDGYTKEASSSESVRILVATEAKSTPDINSLLDKAFYQSFLEVINRPEQCGMFNIKTQFQNHKEVLYKPLFGNKSMGKPVVFDMDMSPGDFLALIYLLKLPVELIDLKGILVSANGWATAATIDVVYDVLHMMGRDDIPVGLGDVFAIGQAYPSFPAIGDCNYIKVIPHGSGGFLDSDTLYGLARDLPRSPRRYKAGSSEKFEGRQPSALDVWRTVIKCMGPGAKITVLTNGPLTNLAQIVHSEATSSIIRDVYITGGHISQDGERGNVFTVPSNEFAELNMFLDPLAAKSILHSKLNITLIPLHIQRRVSSFNSILKYLQLKHPTPEAAFAQRLLSQLQRLRRNHRRYLHVETFLGEILGAVILAGNHDQHLNKTFKLQPVKVKIEEDISKTAQLIIDAKEGKLVNTLERISPEAYYYEHYANVLGDKRQSAVIASFNDQKNVMENNCNTK